VCILNRPACSGRMCRSNPRSPSAFPDGNVIGLCLVNRSAVGRGGRSRGFEQLMRAIGINPDHLRLMERPPDPGDDLAILVETGERRSGPVDTYGRFPKVIPPRT